MTAITRRTAVGAFAAAAFSEPLWSASRDRPAGDLPLGEVIRRHTAARGGADRLDAVRSLASDITITEKGATLEAHYSCDDSPAWRIDVYDHGRHVFCEGLDADGPWLWPDGEKAARAAVPDARKTGLQGIEFNLYGLHRFPARGHRLSLDGRERLDGVDYHVVRATMKDSYETFLFISPLTWMIERRRDYRAFHPDVDPKKVFAEKRYADFRRVDGIVSPFSEQQANWQTGEIVNSTAVKRMVFNPALKPGELTRTFQANPQ